MVNELRRIRTKMNLPELIPIGQQGWKMREAERMVIEIVTRSTNPQSGWTIRQKLRRKKQADISGKQLSGIMYSLYKRGYLKRVGFDNDRDSIYVIE